MLHLKSVINQGINNYNEIFVPWKNPDANIVVKMCDIEINNLEKYFIDAKINLLEDLHTYWELYEIICIFQDFKNFTIMKNDEHYDYDKNAKHWETCFCDLIPSLQIFNNNLETNLESYLNLDDNDIIRFTILKFKYNIKSEYFNKNSIDKVKKVTRTLINDCTNNIGGNHNIMKINMTCKSSLSIGYANNIIMVSKKNNIPINIKKYNSYDIEKLKFFNTLYENKYPDYSLIKISLFILIMSAILCNFFKN